MVDWLVIFVTKNFSGLRIFFRLSILKQISFGKENHHHHQRTCLILKHLLGGLLFWFDSWQGLHNSFGFDFDGLHKFPRVLGFKANPLCCDEFQNCWIEGRNDYFSGTGWRVTFLLGGRQCNMGFDCPFGQNGAGPPIPDICHFFYTTKIFGE